ncbi:hypothetical protein [Streptomyces sp. XH2]|uniref:hypothetical protein n=1 Tax=Streptomyces sp. XH2 TaxID=3412483 RepID=UPI003C7D1D64
MPLVWLNQYTNPADPGSHRDGTEAIAPGSTVLAVSPDPGDRYLNTVYDDDWVYDRFGVTDPTGIETTGMTKAGA